MECYIIADSAADTIGISFIIKTFDSCKGGSCSTEFCFFGFRIYIDLAPGKRIREKTGEEFIQIISVRAFCDKAVFQKIIVQIPAYRVAVAEIILKYRCLWKIGSLINSVAEKSSILCGNRVPDIGHQLCAVYNVKFRHIGSSAECSCFGRGAVCLAKEKDSWAYDLADHSCHTEKGMQLPEVFAVHHREDTKAEYRSPLICKFQDLEKHCIEKGRSLKYTWSTGMWVVHRKA